MLGVRDAEPARRGRRAEGARHERRRGRAHRRHAQRLRGRAPRDREQPRVDAPLHGEVQPRREPAHAVRARVEVRPPPPRERPQDALEEQGRQRRDPDGREAAALPQGEGQVGCAQRDADVPLNDADAPDLAGGPRRVEQREHDVDDLVGGAEATERRTRREAMLRSGSASASGSATMPSSTMLTRTSGASSTASARRPVCTAPFAVR